MQAYERLRQQLEVEIEHKGVCISFSISTFGRDSFTPQAPVFHYMNKYWEELPEQTQDAIFEIYLRIQEIFHQEWNTELRETKINQYCIELTKLHPVKHIRQWIAARTNIMVPDNIKREFGKGGDAEFRYTVEKTYVYDEYVELVAMSLALRCMVPIWGEYIHFTRKPIGTARKEMNAMALLNNSPYQDSAAFKKLMNYISTYVNEKKLNPQNTIDGIASQDIPYWLFCFHVVKKLCVADIRGTPDTSDVVRGVYKLILQRLENEDLSATGFRAKNFPEEGEGGGSGAGDEHTAFERYKLASDLSPGQLSELSRGIRNPDWSKQFYMLQSIAPNLTAELLEECMQIVPKIMNIPIGTPQRILAGWLIEPFIPSLGFDYLPAHIQREVIGMCHALLWSRGHTYISLLMASYPTASNEFLVSTVDSKKAIPEEIQLKLDYYYPHLRPVTGRRGSARSPNTAIRGITAVTEGFVCNGWTCVATPRMIFEVTGNYSSRPIIRPEIRVDLAKIVLEIAEGFHKQ